MARRCERCGSGIQPRWPRVRQGNGQLWCSTCNENQSHVQTTANAMIQRLAAGWSGEDVIRHEIGRQRVHTVGGDGGVQLCPNHLSTRQAQDDFATGLAAQVGLDHGFTKHKISPPHEGKCVDCAQQYGPKTKGLPWEPQQHRPFQQHEERQPTPHNEGDDDGNGYQRGRWPYRPHSPNRTERFVPVNTGIQSLNYRRAVVVTPGDPSRIQTTARIRVQAHDSGDGETIFHCPFCGSGQVIARSDGTVECEFCSTAFTVQVQPQMPAFPQTIDGVPVDVPGMPAGGANANVPPDGGGMDPMAADGPPGAEEEGDPEEDEGGDEPPAFLKGSKLLTERGDRITRAAFARRLALTHMDREHVLAKIRDENGAR